MCSRSERAEYSQSKLKQMNLLLIIDTVLDKCMALSLPLEWSPEWLCVRDSDLEQDVELRELARRAFEDLDCAAFVKFLRQAAAQIFPPLQDAWLPVYDQQSLVIFEKWRASQVRLAASRPVCSGCYSMNKLPPCCPSRKAESWFIRVKGIISALRGMKLEVRTANMSL